MLLSGMVRPEITMTIAELHGKISRSGENLHDQMEDLLTSDVFSACKYVRPARLQSFPDGFLFVGQMNAAFRQIGNYVPALMAFALAGKIKELLLRSISVSAPEIFRDLTDSVR